MSFMLSAGQAIMGGTEMSPVHGETKTTGWHFQELNMDYTHSAELNKTGIKNKHEINKTEMLPQFSR